MRPWHSLQYAERYCSFFWFLKRGLAGGDSEALAFKLVKENKQAIRYAWRNVFEPCNQTLFGILHAACKEHGLDLLTVKIFYEETDAMQEAEEL